LGRRLARVHGKRKDGASMLDTRSVVDLFFQYWCVQDVENTMALTSDDVVYQLNISETALAFGGTTRGREAVRDAFYTMLAGWNYLVTDVTHLVVDGPTAKARIRFRYHHIKSDTIIDGTFTFVIEVADGLITRVDAIHDKERIEAFLRLMG
jgi:ketosteroid isomerase-like protein